MGPSSWTGKLHDKMETSFDSLANRLDITADTLDFKTALQINLDGPYGNVGSYESFQVLFLVAGGIGITPIISVMKDLAQPTESAPKKLRVKKVYLCWTVRYPQYLNWFWEFLRTLHGKKINGIIFYINLFVTRDPSNTILPDEKSALLEGTSGEPVAIPFTAGRPRWDATFDTLRDDVRLGQVWTAVCGPKSMNQDIQWMCHKHTDEELEFFFQDQTFFL